MSAMDYDSAKTSAYLDPLESTSFIDSGLDYLQYPPSSPSFTALALPAASGSPSLSFNALNLTNTLGDYTYSSPAFSAPSPARSYSPSDGASISPPTLTYALSNELPAESIPQPKVSGRTSRSSGTVSPPAVSYPANVPRSQRYNPIAIPATRASARAAAQRRRSNSQDQDASDDEDEFHSSPPPPAPSATNDTARRETIRRQRIESEQRRRDELRDGYARLKETLPPSNQKSSKVSLLDRATSHIRYVETCRDQLELRLKAAEAEVIRLRNVNEALMLSTANQRAAASHMPHF
ncbi:hypothetical protein AX16_000272 [Volvariella volvacea WC 439]|nr:hypothetical protein AX16_000272 [Volvariella volvacea WC 439]